MTRLLSIVVLFIVTASLAQASGFMRDMISEAERSHTYENNGRKYYVGPTASMRSKNTSVRPVSITPPSLEVGCNGFNFSTGGISFLSREELAGVFEQLTNVNMAIYLGYSIGMKMLSPELTGTIETAMDIIEKMNSMSLDACGIADNVVEIASSSQSVGEQMKAKKDAFMKNIHDGHEENLKAAYRKQRQDPDTIKDSIKKSVQSFSGKKYLLPVGVDGGVGGGSLLEFLFTNWAPSTSDGGAFTFPNVQKVAELRALYGDLYVNMTDIENVVYNLVPACGKDLQEIENSYAVTDNETRRCIEDNTSTISSYVKEGTDNLLNIYGKRCDEVACKDASEFVRVVASSNMLREISELATRGNLALLELRRPTLERKARNELSYRYVDIYYQHLYQMLKDFQYQAEFYTTMYGEPLKTNLNAYIFNMEKQHNRYTQDYMSRFMVINVYDEKERDIIGGDR